MPDLVIYLTEDDQLRFVRFVLETGSSLIADINSEDQSFPIIECLATYEAHRARSVGKFFIQRSDFTRFRPTVRSIQKDGRQIYYISQRYGGPFIDFSGGGVFQEDGHTFVRPGGFGHYPSYFQEDVEHCAPEALKKYHAELRHYLLHGAMRLGRTKTRPWVLAGAIEAMRNGAKLGGFEDRNTTDLEPGNARTAEGGLQQ